MAGKYFLIGLLYIFGSFYFCNQVMATDSIIPSPAAEAGYTQVSFSDNFDSLSTIDSSLSGTTGFKWYPHNFLGYADTPAANINVSNSILTLGGPGLSHIATARLVAQSPPLNIVGRAFADGAYFEARIALDTSTIDASQAGWPGFWAGSAQNAGHRTGMTQWPGQPTGYDHMSEIDFMEYYLSNGTHPWGPNVYTGTVHDWFGVWKQTCPSSYCRVNNSQYSEYGPTNFQNAIIHPVEGTNLNDYHTYGALWIPYKEGGQGLVKFYFDNQPTTAFVTWTGTPQNPPPGLAPWTFSIIDQTDFVVILHAGGGVPMKVDWVKVYQKDPTPLLPKPGDSDGDSDIDGIDYVNWLNHYSQNLPGTSRGDFNTSGIVDGVDYIMWVNNYGR